MRKYDQQALLFLYLASQSIQSLCKVPDKYVWRYQTLQRADHGEQAERDGPVTDLIYNVCNLYNVCNIYNLYNLYNPLVQKQTFAKKVKQQNMQKY